MFTQANGNNKKKVFQKPNILRKKSKAKRGVQKYAELLGGVHHITAPIKPSEPANINSRIYNTQLLPVHHEARNIEVSNAVACSNGSAQALHAKAQIAATTSEINIPTEEIQLTLDEDKQNNTFLKNDLYMINSTLLEQGNYNEEEQSLNIESFLVNSPIKQSTASSDSSLSAKKTESEVENKWCLNFMSDDSKDIITPSFYDGAQISKVDTDISTNPISFSNKTNALQTPNVLEQDIIQSCITSRVSKYKCDVANCDKSFWSEAKLQKHQSIHNRKKNNNGPATVECPVKKVDSEGVEQRCGQVFPTRDLLVKHLNEDHVPEDAAHRCVHCSRRFWWATGMRTHLQTPCTRALTCTWEGCGRVFRQPCRLREHARAHTGDRPYPCDYPNCGWAFRSASKLVRHARRHTGERKHECAACGRAFPRREHLRDHAARHHARELTPCTHPGCEETFANTSLLYLHMKRAHRPDGSKPAPKKSRAKKKAPKNDVIVMTLDGGAVLTYDTSIPDYTSIADAIETANASAMIMPETGSVDNNFTEINEPEREERGVEGVKVERFGYDLEGKCARTHCTWPLQKTEGTEPAYSIEEDTQVEPEGSESNIYTVRSDLFLHGNVLINEDSEFIIRESSNRTASEVEDTSNTGQLDGLDLINSHPTIDLMQEELMYVDDAAVDESSFRVFLMNGEELS